MTHQEQTRSRDKISGLSTNLNSIPLSVVIEMTLDKADGEDERNKRLRRVHSEVYGSSVRSHECPIHEVAFELVGANPEWTASGESFELVPEQANAKGEGFVSWVWELGKSENYAKLLECLRPGGRAPLLIGLPLALPLLSPVWAVEMRS